MSDPNPTVDNSSSITLFNKPYTVIFSDEAHSQGNLGSTNADLCVIHLRSGLPREQTLETLLHEILHVVSTELSLGLPEETIRRLSVGLFCNGVEPTRFPL